MDGAYWRSMAATARLPDTDDVIATFGAPPEGASVPLARFSRLYDVLNQLVIEADFESRHVGERVLAGKHLAATGDNDLLLYDRGYPAFWLFALHHQEQRHFFARMSLDFSGEVTAFLASGKKSAVVLFSPGTDARKQCRDCGLSSEPIPLRLIRVPLKGVEIEVLATSLLDGGAHPNAWFKRHYRRAGDSDSAPRRIETESRETKTVAVIGPMPPSSRGSHTGSMNSGGCRRRIGPSGKIGAIRPTRPCRTQSTST